jgi:hypothetical protein
MKITAGCLAPTRGQVLRSSWNAAESQALQPKHWLSSLDAIRARPSLFFVLLYYVPANGLRGNSRLKSLTSRISSNRDVLALAGALKENKGLVECTSAMTLGRATTPGAPSVILTLEVLEFRNLYADPSFVPSVITSRVQSLVDMLKGNMSIHTIRVHFRYSEHELFQGSVIPYLETNLLRPRLLAIQKTRPILHRTKVLGRALLAVRTDGNSFWMLLSGNLEVALP